MQRFRNILVVVEEESQHEAAFARALWLARANGARLRFLDLAGGETGTLRRLLAAIPGVHPDGLAAAAREAHGARVEAMAARAREAGLTADAAVDEGTGFIAVIGRVLRDGHDLVLKGLHTGASRLPGAFRGPDLHLFRKCPCPVWIVRDETSGGTRRILACVDPDIDEADTARADLNRTVLALAQSLAARDGASVDLLGVWRVEGESFLRSGRFQFEEGEVDRIVEKERLASLARLEAISAAVPAEGVTRNVLHLKGVPGDVIPEHAAQAGIDTIVMGTVGRAGIVGLIAGNTAETVLGRVTCSVLAVKPEGFVSPVPAAAAAG
jgi:nucleotide-binding universal stress UspA family protein